MRMSDWSSDVCSSDLAGRLQLAHAGGVDQAGAGGHRNQRAVGGGVAAARVAFADLAGLHPFAAEQGVGERGLAGAGRADQDDAARTDERRVGKEWFSTW